MTDHPVRHLRRPGPYACRWGAAFLALMLLGAGEGRPSPAAPADPARIPVNLAQVPGPEELVRSSDLILHGYLAGRTQSHPTGELIAGRQVVHYVQHLTVKEAWKGSPAGGPVPLLTSGVEPLPAASDPLNRTYTGPLEEGEYVCFLRRAGSSGMYSLTGIWQGLYPVFEGKSIALLDNGGFPSFDGLALPEMKSKVLRMAR